MGAGEVAVVIPWRDLTGCPSRRAAMRYVDFFYFALVRDGLLGNARVIWADCPGEFTKPRALNRAIEVLPAGTVIVQSDPDSVLALSASYGEAVALARAEPGLVVPHDRALYLNERSTRNVLQGAPPRPGGWLPEIDCDEPPVRGVGNVTVFTRETWDGAGGYDERFPVWGGDDAAFAYACEAFHGPTRRLDGDMIHLHHPRQPMSNPEHPDYVKQFVYVAEYRDAAAAGPEAVREYVAARDLG